MNLYTRIHRPEATPAQIRIERKVRKATQAALDARRPLVLIDSVDVPTGYFSPDPVAHATAVAELNSIRFSSWWRHNPVQGRHCRMWDAVAEGMTPDQYEHWSSGAPEVQFGHPFMEVFLRESAIVYGITPS